MIERIDKDKNFYKKLISLASPIALQNFISSSLNMVDNVMIGRLGETHLASVGLANQFFFLFVLLLFGLNSGASIFLSQFWGKKDILNIRKILGIALIVGGFLSFLFGSSAFFIPKFIMSIFSQDSNVVNLGSQYLKIVSLSYFFTTISFAYGFASRSIGEPKLPMVVSAISLGCNTILNYLLIFGNFGFPQLGIKGAALATLISRTLEMLLTLKIIYGKKGVLAGRINEMFNLSKNFIVKFFKTSIPVILNEGFWSLGMTMYSIAYGRIGTEAFAAVQITLTIQNLFMVISIGMGNASSVMIGNKIGANEEKEAISYAKKFSILGPSIGLVMGIILILLSPFILKLFSVNNVVHQNASRILIIMGIFMAIRVFNIILVVGILRGGGDTKFSLFLETGSVWLVGVPLAFLGALVWRLPVYWVFTLVSLEELVKATIGIPRIISKKWVRNVVEYM
ncbi:MATE family efflux transporter [Thermohalobacter berrensis]|uniref:MATE family efflux transporter n=1 Tax=Thermohalobacter berrensis TaxID=99594 RepID=A0A419SWF9_9FIRM|nr:MATE family efflux transporter [Thermohalobacter berrensis]RKD29556.1 MATE family efflux transporter [Thermohalobacter berrensis]